MCEYLNMILFISVKIPDSIYRMHNGNTATPFVIIEMRIINIKKINLKGCCFINFLLILGKTKYSIFVIIKRGTNVDKMKIEYMLSSFENILL